MPYEYISRTDSYDLEFAALYITENLSHLLRGVL